MPCLQSSEFAPTPRPIAHVMDCPGVRPTARARLRSIRRSGISHMRAASTYNCSGNPRMQKRAPLSQGRRAAERPCPSNPCPVPLPVPSPAPRGREFRVLQQQIREARRATGSLHTTPSGLGQSRFSPIQPVTNGINDSQNSRCRLAQRIATAHLVRRMKHVMMIVPVDAEIDEAEHVAQEDGKQRPKRGESAPWGTFSSSTMMVMMIASTPSLNASIRVLVMTPLR